jgi:hypothetical protein
MTCARHAAHTSKKWFAESQDRVKSLTGSTTSVRSPTQTRRAKDHARDPSGCGGFNISVNSSIRR